MTRHRFFRTSQQSSPARRRVAGWALACAAAVFAGGVLPVVPAVAQGGSSQMLERRVKAAFLYKFLGYADFPAAAFADGASPLTIGVVGSDDMAAELARVVAGRQVRGRPVVVRTLRENEPAPVHLLFVAGTDNARAARVLRGAAGATAEAPAALLTVTECDLGLQSGSVINFRIIEERVRFDVSLDSAERNNVKLSSRLLTVANRVVKGSS
ncbi:MULTISPECIES: YfiR family protein [unclassified Massilia]|uniref:YfiR family protein n=1 Tax=unclassified Massilia TaxID=2609279 RepID=UPI00177D1A9D|nr:MULTISPECIES: YfiR family protein [unclassified Massilia]MBD8532297.1 YfiR family protein [Massilia sp. CFBP 13647]MBD8673830.1 YfiR family protein [Massilia sp. CFBP 13721]